MHNYEENDIFVMLIFSNDADDDDDDEQTQGMANRVRNLATIFVVAQWTLGKTVTPGYYHYRDKDMFNDDDDDGDDDDDDDIRCC